MNKAEKVFEKLSASKLNVAKDMAKKIVTNIKGTNVANAEKKLKGMKKGQKGIKSAREGVATAKSDTLKARIAAGGVAGAGATGLGIGLMED